VDGYRVAYVFFAAAGVTSFIATFFLKTRRQELAKADEPGVAAPPAPGATPSLASEAPATAAPVAPAPGLTPGG
jgi:hypothetical protein